MLILAIVGGLIAAALVAIMTMILFILFDAKDLINTPIFYIVDFLISFFAAVEIVSKFKK